MRALPRNNNPKVLHECYFQPWRRPIGIGPGTTVVGIVRHREPVRRELAGQRSERGCLARTTTKRRALHERREQDGLILKRVSKNRGRLVWRPLFILAPAQHARRVPNPHRVSKSKCQAKSLVTFSRRARGPRSSVAYYPANGAAEGTVRAADPTAFRNRSRAAAIAYRRTRYQRQS